MNILIENETQFTEAINLLGDKLTEVKTCEEEAKALKRLVEAYANKNRVWKHKTERYGFRMERGNPALKRLDRLDVSDVVALLRKSETMRGFICDTYDADAIKGYAAGLADPAEALAACGLFLTDPQRHALVKSL